MFNLDVFKLERFDGTNFTRWKDKLLFLLIELGIAYLLSDHLSKIPKPSDEEPEVVTASRKKREEDEVRCRGFILNSLSDRLYDLFWPMKSPQEIWRVLENTYTSKKQDTQKSRKADSKSENKRKFDEASSSDSANNKKTKSCFFCNKKGHFKKECSSSSSKKHKGIDLPIEPRKCQRARKEKNLGADFISSQAIVLLAEGSRD
ncbi:hypothetical protein RJ640_011984 [Escallonia rubra]|uniref:CCHC-type domain-containing protein n=1 Tax=Escallonia rubra TaxID=112253 RepID=A0AA88RFK0_9ASTE|nr:hypothetical protein RJ640_011984 [Escallonia rubra]